MLRVIGARPDDDADLPHAGRPFQSTSSSVSTVSAAIARVDRRPTTSANRAAGIPVPGFLIATISGPMTAPGSIGERRDDALLEDPLHVGDAAQVVLVDRRGEHPLDVAYVAHEPGELVRLERHRGVGAVHLLREGEVLLDRSRTERCRCDARGRAQRVVGEADRQAVALPHLEHHVQPHVLRWARVLRGALEDGQRGRAQDLDGRGRAPPTSSCRMRGAPAFRSRPAARAAARSSPRQSRACSGRRRSSPAVRPPRRRTASTRTRHRAPRSAPAGCATRRR